MPVKQFIQERSETHDQLVGDLLREWKCPNQGNTEPVILEETGQDGKLAHIYVVWSRWAHLDRIERSEIVMEAAERKMPPHRVMDISIAMGLTPDEAKRMRIKY